MLRDRVRDRQVLDVGAGTGALAIAAARAGAASVTAVDLSRRSAAATWLNSRLHRVPVTVRCGDLFAPVRGRRFDVVVANPPYVPAATQDPARYRMARCWDGGHDGRLLLDRLCAGLPDVLTDDGTALIVHSEVCGEQATIAAMEAVGPRRERDRAGRAPVRPGHAGPCRPARRPRPDRAGATHGGDRRRGRGASMSELASESSAQRPREASTERSEGER